MENRRPTTTVKPFSPRKYYDKNRQNQSSGYAKFQNREGSGDNKVQNRTGSERFQNRAAGGYQNREDNRFQNRDGRVNREGRNFRDNENFRDNRNNSQNGTGKYISRGTNKFTPKARFPANKRFEKPRLRENNIKIVSDLQITDGKHKGKYLQNSTSVKARTTDRRVRDIMFKILFRRVRAGRFLDLCAGSGTMGIEAISRGAIISTFVERSAKMCSYIKKNLAACGIKEGHGEVCEMEVLPFLKKMAKRRRIWDVVYLNPPYDADYEEILNFLKRGTALKPTGVLVIEHHAEMFFPENFGVMKRWRVVVQDETALSFYERK
jgi:16S rRNA (guanine(966)-N(2))-methyltransferase RsmD